MKYKDTLEIFNPSGISDGAGGTEEETGDVIFKLRCRIIPAPGSRFFQFGQVSDGKPMEIVTRYRADLDQFSLEFKEVDRNYLYKFRDREITVQDIFIDNEERKFITILAFEKA